MATSKRTTYATNANIRVKIVIKVVVYHVPMVRAHPYVNAMMVILMMVRFVNNVWIIVKNAQYKILV